MDHFGLLGNRIFQLMVCRTTTGGERQLASQAIAALGRVVIHGFLFFRYAGGNMMRNVSEMGAKLRETTNEIHHGKSDKARFHCAT
jgi:hypothetical protein